MTAQEFDVFYTVSSPRLVGQLYVMTGDWPKARDAVHKAFIRAWSRRDFDLAGTPEAWVLATAWRLAVPSRREPSPRTWTTRARSRLTGGHAALNHATPGDQRNGGTTPSGRSRTPAGPRQNLGVRLRSLTTALPDGGTLLSAEDIRHRGTRRRRRADAVVLLAAGVVGSASLLYGAALPGGAAAPTPTVPNTHTAPPPAAGDR
ncbi:sigma factor [Streptacidiphilus rugosus]|uniref:sigma factor n=1 Tax=Streptacidiphilus rugosus TaxID=405783 RepID=UPI001E607DDE|nr:sigma factor [Streptacidiphilus rugosus]